MNIPTFPTNPKAIRNLIRNGEVDKSTAGMAPGYVQANLVIVPKDLAFEFLLFCNRNPKPCPVLEVTEAGSYEPVILAPGSDLRYDIPKYRVYRNGELEAEVTDIAQYWTDNLVAFLTGCSFGFETALIRAGIPLRHIETDTTVPMFITNIPTNPAGSFEGPMVVSMRPIKKHQVVRSVQVTSRFPSVHGAPVHIGRPEEIGIKDINNPDLGEPIEVKNDEVPVFWACGVTPQAVAMNSKPDLMITHAPGYMFITDAIDEEYSVL
ncbi:MAG: DUF1445 domain-containing protein [Dehalococcoidia bacterium]|nr:DUF1445 domain-containing protein [Dehalococcoidia bacterium]